MYPLKYFLVLFIVLISLNANAQKRPIKFGKISNEEIELKYCSFDSAAHAVVLGDFGSSRFTMNPINHEWQIIFERHTRIKILSKDGLDEANVKIPFYHGDGTDNELIGSLKAASYNVENGKLKKVTIEKNAVFVETINENWSSYNFTIPNVVEGSIIEYSYRINSDFIRNLREWEFQGTIPVIISGYEVTIPEYFNYQLLHQGYEQINQSLTSVEESFKYDWTSMTAGNYETGSSTMNSVSKLYKFQASNLPAIEDENYINTYKNYISKISFELLSVYYRGQSQKQIMGTWEHLTRSFLNSTSFGEVVRQSGYLSKNVEELIDPSMSDQEKLVKIYKYVQQQVKWNGYYAKYCTSGFKEAMEKHIGNSAEINLLLTSMLQKAGLKADPVLISTTNNGFIRSEFAISDQFNHVICQAKIDEKTILLDATDPYLPIGVLPKKCLNDKGWVVSESNSGWVSLNSKTKAKTQFSGNLKFTENGVLIGNVTIKFDGYHGRDKRHKFYQEGEVNYVDNLISNSKWNISEVEIENESDLSQPFIEQYNIEINEPVNLAGEVLYVDPFISQKIGENPFKAKERKFPVNLSSKIDDVYFLTIDIPKGFNVAELPTSQAINLPNKAGSYVLQVSNNEDQITMLGKFKINKLLFSQLEYPTLKEFYNQVIQLQDQLLVFKSI